MASSCFLAWTAVSKAKFLLVPGHCHMLRGWFRVLINYNLGYFYYNFPLKSWVTILIINELIIFLKSYLGEIVRGPQALFACSFLTNFYYNWDLLSWPPEHKTADIHHLPQWKFWVLKYELLFYFFFFFLKYLLLNFRFFFTANRVKIYTNQEKTR